MATGLRRPRQGVLTLARMSTFADASASSSSSSTTTSRGSRLNSLVRQVIKPFLLQCHPDVTAGGTDGSSSYQDAVAVNLKAIQTLNSYVDTIQLIVKNSTSSGSSRQDARALQRPDSRIVDIEFILQPSRKQQDDDDNDDNETTNERVVYDVGSVILSSKRKYREQVRKLRERETACTRRRVQLLLPPWEWVDQLTRPASRQQDTEEDRLLWWKLQGHVLAEMTKLLHVAGLKVPPQIRQEYYQQQITHMSEKSSTNEPDHNKFDAQDALFYAFHMDDDPEHKNRSGNTSSSSSSMYERSRQAFTASIDWNKVNRLWNETMQDRNADLATSNILQSNNNSTHDTMQKQKFIANILSKVQYQHHAKQQQDEKDKNENHHHDDHSSSNAMFLEELIALRRLSLLLQDNFEKLRLEDMGRLWENMTLVLTPPRPANKKQQKRQQQQQKKRQQQQQQATATTTATTTASTTPTLYYQDNGFCFTLHADWSVTMEIPIDFRDEEILAEWERNLDDFYNLMTGGSIGSSGNNMFADLDIFKDDYYYYNHDDHHNSNNSKWQ